MKTLNAILTACIVSASSTAIAQTDHQVGGEAEPGACEHSDDAFRCVRYVRNYDADTVTVNIHDVHPLFGREISIRIKGVDTPEIKGKSACEKKLAAEAQQAVAHLLAAAKRIDLVGLERDKYFRVVADLVADGQSLSSYLLKSGLAYSYDGGTKSQVDWCTFSKTRAAH